MLCKIFQGRGQGDTRRLLTPFSFLIFMSAGVLFVNTMITDSKESTPPILCFKTALGFDHYSLYFSLCEKIWHCWKHQCDRGPGEETGRPVQWPGHQHAQVLIQLLCAGVRGRWEGHHCGTRQEGMCISSVHYIHACLCGFSHVFCFAMLIFNWCSLSLFMTGKIHCVLWPTGWFIKHRLSRLNWNNLWHLQKG